MGVLQRLKDDGKIRIPLIFIAGSFFLFFKRTGERLNTRCSLEKGPADVLAYGRGVVPDSCLFFDRSCLSSYTNKKKRSTESNALSFTGSLSDEDLILRTRCLKFC